jgi:hypothetical protein
MPVNFARRQYKLRVALLTIGNLRSHRVCESLHKLQRSHVFSDGYSV